MSAPFRYFPKALDSADALLDWCRRTPHWRTERIRLFGREAETPRMIAWYGDPGISYRYSGLDHPGQGWPPTLGRLRQMLNERFRLALNFALLNRYRDGRDWLGWHRDDERGLAGCVLSVSLGATRRLRLDLGSERIALDLEHGSILRFNGALRHSLPRTRKPVAERFNLTFRRIANDHRK